MLLGCQELPRSYDANVDALDVIFADSFDREELGPNWLLTGPGATIEHGELVVEHLQNHPVWLNTRLPEDVRIDVDVWSESAEGDIKLELFGDGESFATSLNYTASGYVVIFGGWHNTTHAIVRRDEHGRRATRLKAEAGREVEPQRRYHFTITRRKGQITWHVDGAELLRYRDSEPLRGPGQDAFALSGWESRVHFDNLRIAALASDTPPAASSRAPAPP